MFCTHGLHDQVILGIMGQQSGYGMILVRGQGIPMVFPMVRTGLLSFMGLYVLRTHPSGLRKTSKTSKHKTKLTFKTYHFYLMLIIPMSFTSHQFKMSQGVLYTGREEL